MDYTKISLEISPNTQENRDIVIALLSSLEYDTFEENENGINAYIQTNLFDNESLTQILSNLSDDIKINLSTEKIEHKNWNEEWEKNFKPVFINENCVIRASFHKINPVPEYDIIINPKMAFGTGHHQTTLLVAKELFEINLKNKYVLDMGCGTGILSIIASKLGAKEIVAIDNDPDSVESTKENIKINKTNNVKVILGDARNLEKFSNFDIIIANINRNILLQDMDKYAAVLSSKAKIILSGFYKKDLSMLLEKAEEFNLKLDKFTVLEDWTMAVLKN